jgi:hypothetical protein
MLASTLPRSRVIPGPKVKMFSSQSVRARLLPATGQRVTEARQGFTFLEEFLRCSVPRNQSLTELFRGIQAVEALRREKIIAIPTVSLIRLFD